MTTSCFHNRHSSSTFPKIMKILIYFFAFVFLITEVDCGCAELRLCCPGRNMSCIALDTGRPRGNALIPEGRGGQRSSHSETASAEVRRRGDRVGGAWHIHVDRGSDLSNFGASMDNGDRFFESLFVPSPNLGDREGAGGETDEKKSENVRLAKTDDLLSSSSANGSVPGHNDRVDGSADGDYGSGDEESFASVDWLKSGSHERGTTSKEESTTEEPRISKVDNYKIAEDDQYQVLTAEQKEIGEGEHVMIRYVIESDEIPVTIEQLEMLQNYRSLVGGADRSCYCDEACQALGDCCGDYKTVCPVIDCIVSDWSGWTPCEASGNHQKYVPVDTRTHQEHCGLGISRRQRRIVREPMHGGTPCPLLVEQRTCYSTETAYCHQKLMSEVAQLLPYEYGRARVPGYKNNSAGIFYDLPKDVAKFNSGKSYCVTFEIAWLNAACSDEEARRHLQPGRRVCVDCQVTAQTAQGNRCVGEGAEGLRSTWNLVNGAKHCHGFWKLLEKKEGSCTCDVHFPNDTRYLFV